MSIWWVGVYLVGGCVSGGCNVLSLGATGTALYCTQKLIDSLADDTAD